MNRTKTAISLLALSMLAACAGVPAHHPEAASPPTASAGTETAPQQPAPPPDTTAQLQDATSDEAEASSAPAPTPAAAAPTPAAAADDQTDSSVQLAASTSLPAPSNDLWQRLRDGFGLPDMDTPLVHRNEEWYAQRPEYVQRMVERSKRYLYYVLQEVEKRRMPTEIALLPMVESAYNPMAYSRSHASGIWQFTAGTAQHYGLKRNWWYDGRRDIVAATDAALDYLENLYQMFGSWDLALAAYNWGEGAVSRAVARNQAKGKATDYLSLRLPEETRNYVPRLIALKHIVMDPAKFGLSLAPIPDRPYFTTVTLDHPVDVKVAAHLAEMPTDEFESLNPAYNRPVVTTHGDATLLLPVGKADTFSENLENYSGTLVSWRSYTAPKRESLSKIARHFRIHLARLKEINDIAPRRRVARRGETLLVPKTTAKRLAIADATPVSGHVIVRRGETLYGIARRHGVSVAQLKAWNGLTSNHLKIGQRLLLRAAHRHKALAATNGEPKGRHTVYTVRRGDTLHSIARRFNVAVNDLQRWNNLDRGHTLHPGEKVEVYPQS